MEFGEKIKRGLECCRNVWVDDHWKNCNGACPYQAEQSYCKNVLHHDTLAYIRQLEAEWYRLVTEVQKLREERDRYWQYIKGMECESCSGDCDKCTVTKDGFTGWEWSGKEKAE